MRWFCEHLGMQYKIDTKIYTAHTQNILLNWYRWNVMIRVKRNQGFILSSIFILRALRLFFRQSKHPSKLFMQDMNCVFMEAISSIGVFQFFYSSLYIPHVCAKLLYTLPEWLIGRSSFTLKYHMSVSLMVRSFLDWSASFSQQLGLLYI